MYTSDAYFVLSIILSLVISTLISYIIYRIKKRSEGKNNVNIILFITRIIAIALVVLVLLNPAIKISKTLEQKPELLFLEDNSGSIKNLTDSIELLAFEEKLDRLKKEFKQYYNVKTYYFDKFIYNSINQKYIGSVSDIGYALRNISDENDEPISSIVLVSDGNYNQGENPEFLANNLPYKLYTIAIGDTLSSVSFYFQNLYHNMIGYTNEKIPIEGDIRYERLQKDTIIDIVISTDNEVIKTQKIKLEENTRKNSFNSYINVNKTGMQKFDISIKGLPESKKSFYLEIREQKQKVLILYHAVHPDIGTIKSALELSNRFEPVIIQAGEFNKAITDYNMVIFHQIPSGRFTEDRWFAEASEAKIPAFVITGPQTDFITLNQGQSAITFESYNGKSDEAGIYYNENFTWFKTDFNEDFDLSSWPPLTVPFAKYKVNKGTSLFYQSLMGIESDRPALHFIDQPYRYAILTGTGLWKWNIYNYRMNGNHNKVNDLIYKTIRFLSLDKPNKRLQVDVQSVYESSQAIDISAIWYNKNYEPDNSLPGNLVLLDTNNKEYKFAFVPFMNKYRIQPGLLPAGEYKYKATVKSNDEIFSDEGRFIVSETNLEKSDYKADISLMRNLSGNERFSYYSDIQSLTEKLKPDKSHKITIKSETHFADIIDEKILLFIIIVLFALEWTIRKYHGKL